MAVFPTIGQSGEEGESNPSYNDSEMDQQAAAAHCIGSLCNTVYLILSYDFEKEKTDLHRAFGGTKLMAFVDGTRDVREDQKKEMNEEGADLVRVSERVYQRFDQPRSMHFERRIIREQKVKTAVWIVEGCLSEV